MTAPFASAGTSAREIRGYAAARFRDAVPAEVKTPADLARFELSHVFPEKTVTLTEDPAMGEGYRIETMTDGSLHITGGRTGLLYGAYRLILDRLCREAVTVPAESFPKYGLRMINCWDNPDGSIERGYAGKSLFFKNGKLTPPKIDTAIYILGLPFMWLSATVSVLNFVKFLFVPHGISIWLFKLANITAIMALILVLQALFVIVVEKKDVRKVIKGIVTYPVFLLSWVIINFLAFFNMKMQ